MRKKHKTQEKTQNSSKKLKVWEAFSAPEVPSGVINKKLELWDICHFLGLNWLTI